MIYKPQIIHGVKFSARAVYNLDLKKWELESRARLYKLKVAYARTGEIIKVVLRARPVFGGQTKLL